MLESPSEPSAGTASALVQLSRSLLVRVKLQKRIILTVKLS
jgi:hypothetical protein